MTFKEFLQEKKKHSKAEAGYVAHPVNGQVCKHCTMWREPNQCTAVAGDIAPDGWCKWYKRSHRKNLHEATLKGLAKNMTLDDIAKKHDVSIEHLKSQLNKGIKVEHEHTGSQATAKVIAMDHLFEDPDYYTKLAKIEEKVSSIDALQAALDVVGFEPTFGTAADVTNTVISGLRAALSKEPDKRKKHIINAGISAISMIPFADVIKLLKLRKAKPVGRLAVQGARALKTYGKEQQASGSRFASVAEKSIHDPVRPGILKRQIKGKITCAKARALKARTKDKGSNTAKGAQRFLNYHHCN